MHQGRDCPTRNEQNAQEISWLTGKGEMFSYYLGEKMKGQEVTPSARKVADVTKSKIRFKKSIGRHLGSNHNKHNIFEHSQTNL